MKVTRYTKEIREIRRFEFDEPVGGYRHWVRVSVNNRLEKWTPRNPDSENSLQTVTAGEDLEKDLELRFQRNYEDKLVR